MRPFITMGWILALWTASSAFGQPQAVVETRQNLGWVWRGDEIRHQVEVRNEGDVPLEIRGARVAIRKLVGGFPPTQERVISESGPCTFLDPETAVAPGELAHLTAHCRTESMTGDVVQELILLTNDPNLERWDVADNPVTGDAGGTTQFSVFLSLEVRDRFHYCSRGGTTLAAKIAKGDCPSSSGLSLGPSKTAGLVLWAADQRDFRVNGAHLTAIRGGPLPAKCGEALQVSFREAQGEERNPGAKGRQWLVEVHQTTENDLYIPCNPLALRVETDHSGQPTLATFVRIARPRR